MDFEEINRYIYDIILRAESMRIRPNELVKTVYKSFGIHEEF